MSRDKRKERVIARKEYRNYEEMLFDADQMLYVVKRNGKDRVETTPASPTHFSRSRSGTRSTVDI